MATSALTPGRLIWPLVPILTVGLSVFLTILPYGFVSGRFVTPAFALIPIYYWTLHRPQLTPAVLLFVMGLGQDVLTGGPIGLWALVFLATYSITLWQRPHLWGLPFRVAIFAFAGVALAGLTVGWFGASVSQSAFIDVRPMLYQVLTTMAAFAIFVWPLVVLEREIAMALRH